MFFSCECWPQVLTIQHFHPNYLSKTAHLSISPLWYYPWCKPQEIPRTHPQTRPRISCVKSTPPTLGCIAPSIEGSHDAPYLHISSPITVTYHTHQRWLCAPSHRSFHGPFRNGIRSRQHRLLQQTPLQIQIRLTCAFPDLVLIGWLLHQGYEIDLWDVFEPYQVVPRKFGVLGT